jgi:UDP-GlcNAc:undecaprenyl-phosphate GlcNAc-1-phosphate transferase
MDLRLPLAVLVLATALSAALVPLSRVLARHTGVLDKPGQRKIHDRPIPRLGGIAVFASFVCVVLAGYLFTPVLVGGSWARAFGEDVALLAESYRVRARLLALLGGAAVVFAVGLLDDVLGNRFPVWLKAAGQLLAAVILVAAPGVRTYVFPFDWMNVVITLIWIVGMTNAFNLLDNMDGLSAGVALVASGILTLNAWLLGEYFITLIFAAFMGSLLGFLFFNFNPASVFLGDCGSLVIGYLMGSLTLLERYVTHASSTLFPVLMPVVVLAVPILDTATVVAIRLREGRPIYVGDSRHLSHKLVSLGFSQRAAVLFIYLVTFSLGLGAFSLVDASPQRSLVILLQLAGFVSLLMILMFAAPAPRADG